MPIPSSVVIKATPVTLKTQKHLEGHKHMIVLAPLRLSDEWVLLGYKVLQL